jgi:HEAT repeat protein
MTSATPASRTPIKGPPLKDVLQEHLEELAFLGIQRRKLLFSHDVPLRDFGPHDQRIAAHWDGLVIGGEAAVELARDRLAEPDPWDVYAAARVWMDLGSPAPEEVFEAIERSEDESPLGWREALKACRASTLAEWAPAALDVTSPAVEAAFAYGLGWHGLLPPERLHDLAASGDPEVRWGLARALGWQAGTDEAAGRLTASLVTDPDPRVRAAAIWSVALVNLEGAGSWCRGRAAEGDCDSFHIRLLGLLGRPEDLEILLAFARSECDGREAGVFALGDMGTQETLAPLREWFNDPDPEMGEAARHALEVTLDDLPPGSGSEGDLESQAEEAGPDESEDEWWATQTGKLTSGVRMLRGVPFPWTGEPDEEPMLQLWRSLLTDDSREPAWLRREIPDGWLSGIPSVEAIPGE